MFRAVVFDMDGVITDTEKLYRRFQLEEGKKLGIPDDVMVVACERIAGGTKYTNKKSFEDVVCAMSNYLSMSWEEKYEILASDSHRERCDKMEAALYEFIEFVRVGNAAESEQKETHESAYRESAIKKQIEYLQRQLDDMHPENITDVRRFEKKIRESGMNEEAKKEAEKVLNRMKQEGKDGHEYGMLYDYLDFVTSLAWKTEAMKDVDLVEAEKILDEDHYGLEKVKERILEFLAVRNLTGKGESPIICLVGPPGTGKTSIARSIARALDKKYVRISLGGVRDEAEIRGHRRTYIGAMPGRILSGMKSAGVNNPVFLLDEIDKMSSDFRGDPASAMLEVLDPNQNDKFKDHYLEIPYDLSKVMFVATANTTESIPTPLLDRMELIELTGYTYEEKLQIAKRYLLPKQIKNNGMSDCIISVSDDALMKIIAGYTRESGVRNLEREIGSLIRKLAVKRINDGITSFSVNADDLKSYLGAVKFRDDVKESEPLVDQRRRRYSESRNRAHSRRQRRYYSHGKHGRCHEGIVPDCSKRSSQSHGKVRYFARKVYQIRFAYSYSRRSNAKRRAERRNNAFHGGAFGYDGKKGSRRRCYDRRGYSDRKSSCNRRA